MSRRGVLFLLRDFPQLSQTYIKTEIEAFQEDFELRVVALNRPDVAHHSSVPYVHETDPARILDEARAFRPLLVHTHYLTMIRLVSSVCRHLGVPFTVRAHSTDCLRSPEGVRHVRSVRPRAVDAPSVRVLLRRWYRRVRGGEAVSLSSVAPVINDELCLGLLSFP